VVPKALYRLVQHNAFDGGFALSPASRSAGSSQHISMSLLCVVLLNLWCCNSQVT
jgi:hypothetical protein